jgi:hypothetical protein
MGAGMSVVETVTVVFEARSVPAPKTGNSGLGYQA